MIINDYEINIRVYETKTYTVFYGKDRYGRQVVVKQLKITDSSQLEMERFRHEFKIIKNLEIEHIIKLYDLITFNDKPAIVQEYFEGGIPLKNIISEKENDIGWFLRVAIILSETLGAIHSRNIFHKDIKPANILIKDELVKLTDFGIASELTREKEFIYNTELIEETLPYMSPEQTGRMNRSVDYRSDLYSLGITFYEMLTTKLPFKSKDPLELIHQHIAKIPDSPTKLNALIPQTLSDITMKLLSKSPEERYQNSFGLAIDLKKCLKEYEKFSEIKSFKLARHDISPRFIEPQIIVGREKEIEILMHAFDQASSGKTEVVQVYGQPGIGKSAIINEIHRPILSKRGYFISGKYDQFRRSVPYSSIIQAFQSLIKQLLSEGDERMSIWREKIFGKLGSSAKVIIDAIPEMELLIGVQPEVPDLASDASQNRFNYLFKKFISVFTVKEHPLVIFLDDLQWSDAASLNLLKTILQDTDIKYLLIILSYRDNEIEKISPIHDFLDVLTGMNIAKRIISLSPLDVHMTNKFITNLIHADAAETLDLAGLVQHKTAGNPFFVTQFLKTLYDNMILRLSSDKGWQWDIEEIKKMQVTDNVVELLANKIKLLPEKMQNILKICACIGNWFDLEIVAEVSGTKLDLIIPEINKTIAEGFVHYREGTYMFHHDRIQEAAHSLLSEDEREKLHYSIGNLILKKTPEEKLNDKILYIVNQLNAGTRYIVSESEKKKYAELNLKASQKSRSSGAFEAAYNYIKKSINVTGDEYWEKDYKLTLSIYNEAAELAYVNSDYSMLENYSSAVLGKVKSVYDSVDIYILKTTAYAALDRKSEATKTAMEILSKFLFKFSENPTKFHVLAEFAKLKIALLGKSLDSLANLPSTEDKRLIAISKIIIAYSPLLYRINPLTATLLLFINMRLIIKNGNTISPAYSFAAYGLVLCSLGFYDTGYKFGALGIDIIKKYQNNIWEPRASLLFAGFIMHWKESIHKSVDELFSNYHKAMAVGDIDFASSSLMIYCQHIIISSYNLLSAEEKIFKIIGILADLKQILQIKTVSIYLQAVQNLLGKSKDPCRLTGDAYKGDETIENNIKSKDNLAVILHYFYTTKLNYIFKNYENALSASDQTHRFFSLSSRSEHIYTYIIFFDSMIRLELYNKSGRKKKSFLKKTKKNQILLKKWASNAPMNFEHLYLLVEAETARSTGDFFKASLLFMESAQKARENNFIRDEAIAWERTAYFWSEHNNEEYFYFHIKNALACYQKWGAVAKVKQLISEYPQLLKDEYSDKSESGNMTAKLDISTVIKASQVLSGEIMLEKLIEKIMKMSIENAGAERAILLFEKDNRLYIEAETSIESTKSIMQSIPLEEYSYIPLSIINYVNKTNEKVILNDASNDERFYKDPYIQNNKSKSIVCLPILYKGERAGIIYLENNLATNTFTPERMELLQVLSSQSAISLENAKLYKMAITDGLTELITHKYFKYLLEKQVRIAKRYKKVFTLAMIDVDHFKIINDTYGHQAGDLVLTKIAQVARASFRDSDVIARYGGEEFAIIMEETSLEQSVKPIEKFRKEVENLKINYENKIINVAISAGVAAFPVHADNDVMLLRAADNALYYSKENGRNRTTVFKAT